MRESEKKKEKDQVKEESNFLIKPLETDFSITQTDQGAVSNGSVEHKRNYTFTIDAIFSKDGTRVAFDQPERYELNDFLDEPLQEKLSFNDLSTFYKKNLCNGQETYDYLKNYIIQNKDNPEVIQATVESLLKSFILKYDNDLNHQKIGDSQAEILSKILSTPEGENLPGFICGSMHEFLMDTLNECGIKSTLLMGKSEGNHVALLYERSDGKYVFNNYGNTTVVTANNVKDAVKEVYKRTDIDSCGYLTLGDGKSSYQEFVFKDESAFGKEFDKANYNAQIPSDFNIDTNSSVKGNVKISSIGNISATAQGTLAYENGNNLGVTSLAIEAKKTGESALFDNSQSIGLKIDKKILHKKSSKTDNVFDLKGIVAYTKGSSISPYSTLSDENIDYLRNRAVNNCFEKYNIEMEEKVPEGPKITSQDYYTVYEIKNQSCLSVMFRGSAAKKTQLATTDNLNLTNTSKMTGHLGGSFGLETTSNKGIGFFGDARLTAEDEIRLKAKSGDFTFDNAVNLGVNADLIIGSSNTGSVAPGVKLNASNAVIYNPNEKFELGAGMRGYCVVTPSSKDRGASGSLYTAFKPENNNVSYFGNVTGSLDCQNISVGGFNELTENNSTFSATVGAQLNPNTSVRFNYTRYDDKLNKTRSNNAFTVGTRITF